MSDFMERARAEAVRRYAFLDGALWARDVLLADPTDGEVLAAAGVLEYLGLAGNESGDPS